MSDARSRFELGALVAALLLVAAFVTSFVFGIARRPSVDEPAAVAVTPAPLVPATKRGRIEVLNASGRSGLARAVTLQLREAGFDVVFFGNHGAIRDSSVVLDRIGKRDVAQAAATALGITAVRTDRDSTLLLDASVVVGKDWQRRQVQQQQQLKQGWKARLNRWLGR